jgi:hypothetical protein
MTSPPLPAARSVQPVWTHLLITGLVAALGLVLAVAVGWAAIPWAETIGTCVWFGGLCLLCAASLNARVRPY